MPMVWAHTNIHISLIGWVGVTGFFHASRLLPPAQVGPALVYTELPLILSRENLSTPRASDWESLPPRISLGVSDLVSQAYV